MLSELYKASTKSNVHEKKKKNTKKIHFPKAINPQRTNTTVCLPWVSSIHLHTLFRGFENTNKILQKIQYTVRIHSWIIPTALVHNSEIFMNTILQQNSTS